MAIFGFRLHRVTLHQERKNTPLALETVRERLGDPLDTLEDQARRLIGEVLIGTGGYDRDPEEFAAEWRENEARASLPLIVIEDVIRQGRRLTVSMTYGTAGTFDHLLTFDGDRVSLADKAPGRLFNVIVLVPTTGGHGFMISEARGRTYTGELFLKWISVKSRWGAPEGRGWLRWKGRAMSDGQRLNDIRNRAQDLKLQATRHRAAGAPDVGTIRVFESGLAANRVEAVLNLVADWMERRADGAETKEESRRRAGHDVGSLLAPDMHLPDDYFDDGEIKFTEAGKTQTIRPESIDQLFVYPIGEERPTAPELFHHAHPVLQRILDHEDDGLDLDN